MNCVWYSCAPRILQHQLHLRRLEEHNTVDNKIASAGCERVKSVNNHRDQAGRGRHLCSCHRFWALTSCWRVKRSTVTRMRRVGVTIFATVIVFGLSQCCWRVNLVYSHRGQAGRGRHPRNCHRFRALTSCWCVKTVNNHRDQAGRGRHPRNCRRFSCWRVKSVINNYRDQPGRGRHPRNCRRF